MGKPHTPYRAKRLLDAALECHWDFHASHVMGTLRVMATDGHSVIEGVWAKEPAIDGSGRDTTTYTQMHITITSPRKRTAGATLDVAENYIRERPTHTRIAA